jgi:endonuclease/exonuclease/phosphatase family metal-dependent hydrolase
MTDDGRRQGASLKLATWNIHYGIGTDGRFDLDRIISVLAAMDADIVGLQEVGWHLQTRHRVDVFAHLREHTDYNVVEGLVRDPLRTRFGNALLSRFPVARTQWIDLKIRAHVPRAAVMAECETPAMAVRAVSLHLGLATWERERQAQRLIGALAADDTAADGGVAAPTVLLGDFNMVRPRTRASKVLAQGFPTAVREPTYPVRRPILTLDRIYLSPGWELIEAEVFREKPALKASDHLPLLVRARCAAGKARAAPPR